MNSRSLQSKLISLSLQSCHKMGAVNFQGVRQMSQYVKRILQQNGGRVGDGAKKILIPQMIENGQYRFYTHYLTRNQWKAFCSNNLILYNARQQFSTSEVKETSKQATNDKVNETTSESVQNETATNETTESPPENADGRTGGDIVIRSIKDDESSDRYDPWAYRQRQKNPLLRFANYLIWLAIGAVGIGAMAYLGSELFGRMSPANLFDLSLERLQIHDDVMTMVGTPVIAYGMETSSHKEGRRNFIASREYQDPRDGSKRLRVKYTIKGPKGKAFVWAEVSNLLPSGEFVYVIVQHQKTGQIVTVVDNRLKMLEETPSNSGFAQSITSMFAK